MGRARELNPEGICCGVEVLDIRDGEGKGKVEVRERESGVAAEYEARFILVADGGRSLTDKLGIAWLGEGSLFDMVTAHIKAPIRTLHPDPSNFITWFSNPSMGGSMRTGYLYQIGPWPFTSPSEEEWVFACGITESDPKEFSNEIMLDRIRRTLNIPSLDPKLLSLSHWTVNSLYASSWRQGRIFLVGDSAHRIPPFGALGMNTGIQDAANLVWKLSLGLRDESKYSPLLDTYQEERLEVGRRVGLTSLNNMRSHVNAIDAAMGVSPSKTPENNVHEAEGFFSAHQADYAAKREAMSRAVKALDSEFKAPGLEVGWFYPCADPEGEGGATHGGQQTPSGELVSEFFFPSTILGHHLPHAWVERAGERCAVRDLLALDGMTVFAGGADAVMAAPDERVKVVLVGEGNWSDGDGRWRELCGVGDKRGVVVRPDGIVAWRGELANLGREEWEDLLDRLLRVPAR